MRRLIAVAAGWFVVACASAGQPPGGPEDHDPPVILSVKPDSGQLNVRPGQIDFQFDEVVAQQALGATDLSKLFLVSPRNGDPDVSWHRSRITIKLHGQFRTNTAYVVTMFPGLADLRGNVRKEGAMIVFSTGPTIPRFGITGVVFDWAAQHTVPNAYVEAMLRSDTALKFVGVSDTTGHFEIGPLDTGTYLVRGLIDQNSNHQVDRNEKWDTTVAHVTDVRPAVELDAIERDSTPPLLTNVSVDDSVTLHVAFDKYLDPALPLQPALIEVRAADSTPTAGRPRAMGGRLRRRQASGRLHTQGGLVAKGGFIGPRERHEPRPRWAAPARGHAASTACRHRCAGRAAAAATGQAQGAATRPGRRRNTLSEHAARAGEIVSDQHARISKPRRARGRPDAYLPAASAKAAAERHDAHAAPNDSTRPSVGRPPPSKPPH